MAIGKDSTRLWLLGEIFLSKDRLQAADLNRGRSVAGVVVIDMKNATGGAGEGRSRCSTGSPPRMGRYSSIECRPSSSSMSFVPQRICSVADDGLDVGSSSPMNVSRLTITDTGIGDD